MSFHAGLLTGIGFTSLSVIGIHGWSRFGQVVWSSRSDTWHSTSGVNQPQ